MENATKALLIAAAVLIAILLISLGVGIFNKASETVGDVNLSEYEIQQHNDKFSKHAGENQTASEVNSMLKEVFNYNLTQDDNTTMIEVIDSSGHNANIDPDKISTTTAQPKVPPTSRYDVSATYENGLITTLTISNAS